MESERIGNFVLSKASTTQEAMALAYDMAISTDSEILPVTMYRQGERYQVVGAMKFQIVARMLYSESARKGASLDTILSATNRPKDQSHISEIAEYVKTNLRKKYVFGALTLNASQELQFVVVGTLGDLRQGFLILPRTAKVSITDGQHREEAIATLIESDRWSAEDKAELSRQAVAVIITNETEIDQIHQDFADASKAKMLPPSLLRMFDTRNPANRMIPLLERKCELLRGRIEPASKTAGKNSPKLFTTNQVSSFLKEFLTGSWQLGDEEFEARAHRLLTPDEAFEREMDKAVSYVNRVTDAIPILKELSLLDANLPVTRVAEVRDNPAAGGGYVCASATGLVIIGRIGHELFRDYRTEWTTYADRLCDIDWRKNAAIWQGNVVAPMVIKRKGEPNQNGFRILQVANAISRATIEVRAAIGLPARDPRPEAIGIHQLSPQPDLLPV